MPATIDTALLRALRTRWHGRRAERGVLAFTRLGEHGGLWFALAAAAMALSRPYVGVHYPSDGVAGAALGTAVAELAA